TQMRLTARLRSSHFLNAARHPAQSWAGGVAVANAAKNAREAFFLRRCVILVSSFNYDQTYSRHWLRIRDKWELREHLPSRLRRICVICVFFFIVPTYH
ncbi:MAG: hypothetical protein O0W99_03525, partial [Methanocorpusculum sp.]|nr:hypothetical protein [Methanocorpusculum sp.]